MAHLGPAPAVQGLTSEEQETALQLLKKLGLSAQAALKSKDEG